MVSLCLASFRKCSAGHAFQACRGEPSDPSLVNSKHEVPVGTIAFRAPKFRSADCPPIVFPNAETAVSDGT
jgi:hypothetical protein